MLHAMRRNINMTYVVMDNQLYALTKSQASPRSDLGFKTTTTLEGSLDLPISPMKIILSADATFSSSFYW